MGYKAKPKIRKQGGSHYVSIPKEWLEFWGLKEGDQVSLVGNSMIILAPEKLEGKAKKIVLGEIDRDANENETE